MNYSLMKYKLLEASIFLYTCFFSFFFSSGHCLPTLNVFVLPMILLPKFLFWELLVNHDRVVDVLPISVKRKIPDAPPRFVNNAGPQNFV